MRIGVDVRSLMHGRTSGVENYVRNLLKAMFEVDSEHTYVLFYNSKKDCKKFLPEFDGRRVKVVRTKYPNKLVHIMWRFLRWPKVDKLIEKKIKQKIDVMWVPDPRPTPVSAGMRKITTIHDLAFERFPQHFSWRSRLWFKIVNPKHEVETSSKIIAVSEFTKRELEEVYKVDPEKVKVVLESVPGVLKPVMKERELIKVRKKYNLPKDYFLTFSTLEPRKNLENVVKGFSIFQRMHPLETYRLVLAGRKDPKMFGKVFLDEHPDVRMIGFVDEKDKAAVYSAARGLLFVSTYEGFGFPVLEGMACGTPVITSKAASMPEVAGEAALSVDPYDSVKIADAMERLTRDTVAEECRMAGLKQVKNFSWKKAARQTLKVLI
jgi:glycosyltransferase involved in cell wall biosynthesis